MQRLWVPPVAAALLSATLLSGCAGLYAENGFDEIAANARERLGADTELVWIRDPDEAAKLDERVAALLARPLDADGAVRVALLNNRELQAALSDLGFVAADVIETILPANPGFQFKRIGGGGSVELERTVMLDILGVITLPLRAASETRRYEAAKLRTAGRVVALSAEARRAFYGALAARQVARYLADAAEATDAAAELTHRMARVGNVSRLDEARARAFHLEATASLARARAAEVAAQERLNRALGLWGKTRAAALPDRLPDLPAEPRIHDDIESRAIATRADIRAARADVEATARGLGLTRATRFVGLLEAGYDWHTQSGEPSRRGYEVSISVPLFDFGDSRVAKAEHIYMAAVHRAAAVAINARSEVREAYLGYRAAYDVAKRYRDEIVPLRQTISEEMALRYNGMLVSVFELLAGTREQIAGITAAIEAQRDFWLDDVALDAALHGVASK